MQSRAVALRTLAAGGVLLLCGASAAPGALAKHRPPPKRPKPPAFRIVSLPSTQFATLGTVDVGVAGLRSGGGVTVSFSGGGFSTTDTPVAVNGGTVTLAVPLYVDPGTHQIASGSVSLVIHQGSRATPARSVTIQELPALSSYGLRLGDISHAFLVWDALMLGQRINELQAEQQLTGFDASDALATLTEQLRATLLARNDVDRIYTDPTTVIADGVAADGSPLQVDAGTQDLMDRVLAVYLLNELGPSARVRHAARTLAVRAGHRTPTRADDLAAIKDLLESTATARGLVNDLANAQNEGNLLHGVVAIGKAAAEFAEPTLGPELTLRSEERR